MNSDKFPFLLVFLFSIFLTFTLFSQNNLIANGDFEEILMTRVSGFVNGIQVDAEKRDTGFLWQMSERAHRKILVSGWNYAEKDKTENAFFSDTGKAKSGNAYGMITAFQPASATVYFVQNAAAKLTEPLTPDQIYTLSFWMMPFAGNYDFEDFGIKFINEKQQLTAYKEVVKKRNSKISLSPIATDFSGIVPPDFAEGYKYYEFDYVATGEEKFILFGNLNFAIPRKYKAKKLRQFGYPAFRYRKPFNCILIDEVVLKSKESAPKTEKNPIVEKSEIPFAKEKTTIVSVTKNLNFATAVYLLTEKQKEEIRETIEKICDKKIKNITVVGHTDDIGNEEDNIELSLKRARSVSEFIKSRCPQVKVKTEGRGASVPLYSNTSAADREKNRRTEFLIEYAEK